MKKKNKNRLMAKMLSTNLWIIMPFIVLINALSLATFSLQLKRMAVENLKDKSYNSQIYVMGYLKRSAEDDKGKSLEKLAPYLAGSLARRTDMRVQIYGKNGLLSDSETSGPPIELSQDVEKGKSIKSYQYIRDRGHWYLSFSSPIYVGIMTENDSVGTIRYLRSLDKEQGYQIQMGVLLGAVSGAAIIAFWMICLWTSGRIVQPVNELKTACSRLKRGNLQQHVVLNSGDEIEDLGHAFNLMSDRMNEYVTRLDEQQEQLSQLFNSATHQLKTPLTAIIGYSQMIQLQSDKDEVCEDAFIIEEAGENLLRSIELMLEESREKAGWGPLHITTYSLRELIEECVLMLRPRLKKWNITLENNCESGLILRNDRMLSKEAILSILDNAISHSGCDTIRLYAHTEEDKTMLHIIDNGCGIRKEEAGLIFNPFYRSARTMGQGNGLGLSVCTTMMKQNHGTVEVKTGPEGGAEFILTFRKLQL
ncbi:HAMP domain-containing sensor histidine kinase [Lachnospiraceae bacterium 62-35]